MTDTSTKFFAEVEERGHQPALEKVSGTIRFDLTKDGRNPARWLVAIDHGDVSVSRKNVAADCVVRLERSVFDDIVRGKANALAALLRGALTAEGDVEMLAAFQRLFPGPRRTRR